MPVRVCFRVTSKLAPFLYAPPVMGLYISACYLRGAAGPDHFCLAHTVRVPVCSDHRIIRNACFGALSLDLSAWPVMAFALVGIFSVQDNQSGFSTSTLPWRASCSSLEGLKVLLNLGSDPLPGEAFLRQGDTRPRLEVSRVCYAQAAALAHQLDGTIISVVLCNFVIVADRTIASFSILILKVLRLSLCG
jgi:hypothetical protein